MPGTETERARIRIQGAVQGVGFRPFVYRLANELSLGGWVLNDSRGVVVEAEGERPRLTAFLDRLSRDKPAPAVIQGRGVDWLDPVGYDGFKIKASATGGAKTAQVLPDIATCRCCLDELFDPEDRRYRYPFINCTHCGPRLSIIGSLPYDRPRTTMRRFEMCARCLKEYEDPTNRRFHAQPNACPECGPQVALWTASGNETAVREAALSGAAEALDAGKILAVKGLGGFHLMLDARNAGAVRRLRKRKPRREKPLAVMVRDIEFARRICVIHAEAAETLQTPEAPIVLLPRRAGSRALVHESVAPGNPYLGIMLAYTPLHHLVTRSVDFPLVATSGNLADEPICTDEQECLRRLGSIAELFLVHDRPIARHVDDSVVWMLDRQPRLLRRARGHAPRPVLLDSETPTLLAVGAHLKNTVALSVTRQVFVSQHIGDMETPQAMTAFERVISDFLRLYDAAPVALACDLHPDYLSSRWAHAAVSESGPFQGLELIPVQHHHAHLAACLADNGHAGPALGVTWDGTGYGPDGTIWGGEFLLGAATGCRRVGRLREFALPGGAAAVREPRRTALSLLWEIAGPQALEWAGLAPVKSFRPTELGLLETMMLRGVNATRTTSAGRLFDGVAALCGLHQSTSFEGQAAMALEYVADPDVRDAYPFCIAREDHGSGTDGLVVDWRDLIRAVVEDLRRGTGAAIVAARFHNALAAAILAVARAVGARCVALSGGCFQNRLLTERTVRKLRSKQFEVLLHRQVPPNDGGISLGQIAVAAAALAAGDERRP